MKRVTIKRGKKYGKIVRISASDPYYAYNTFTSQRAILNWNVILPLQAWLAQEAGKRFTDWLRTKNNNTQWSGKTFFLWKAKRWKYLQKFAEINYVRLFVLWHINCDNKYTRRKKGNARVRISSQYIFFCFCERQFKLNLCLIR